MKVFATIASGCAVLILTAGCSTRSVQVNVENAKFQQGYLNSKLIGPGTLLLWDMEAAPDRRLTLAPGPDTGDNRTVRHAGGHQLTSMASSGLRVSGGNGLGAIPAEVGVEITRQTAVVVREFESMRFHDPDFVLNEEDFAAQRTRLGEEFADNDQVRFILIAGATLADDARIAIGTPVGEENLFSLAIAGRRYRLSYHGTRSMEWSGSHEPVFIQPRVYRIVRDPAGATGYRFVEDRRVLCDLTEMLNDSNL